ncbi:hypothetical protein [Haliangium ochraceum]|uniref:Uncharacterized protein n=1 Tax=Haliangium ochraceum (strain DSM 14365 / JCM 11303 / SMP-2) TaxID=502025 RepID=D0LR91_HALO1|nr:hypothetical protein [Haliangium ochraceum]ACY17119.1 hypothetical protein Hoch_4628 [Haliangium ochraceum DSM 14365]
MSEEQRGLLALANLTKGDALAVGAWSRSVALGDPGSDPVPDEFYDDED